MMSNIARRKNFDSLLASSITDFACYEAIDVWLNDLETLLNPRSPFSNLSVSHMGSATTSQLNLQRILEIAGAELQGAYAASEEHLIKTAQQ
jgi:hypothetical protein